MFRFRVWDAYGNVMSSTPLLAKKCNDVGAGEVSSEASQKYCIVRRHINWSVTEIIERDELAQY